VEQTQEAAKMAKERGTSCGKANEGFTSILQQAADQTVAAQKKTLEFFAGQQKTAYDTFKRQFRFNAPGSEVFQSGLETLIDTQKAMFDIAAKPLRTVTR